MEQVGFETGKWAVRRSDGKGIPPHRWTRELPGMMTMIMRLPFSSIYYKDNGNKSNYKL